jgi:CRP-like cAMP-binding protein
MPTAIKNRLLAALPPEEVKRFFSDLRPIPLSLRQIVYAVGQPLESVHFIEDGLASILTTMVDGSTIEIGMIGTEGMVGVSALLGAETSAQQIIVQIPGCALRMSAAKCKMAFEQSAVVRRVMLRFTEVIFNLSAQTAACNRLHLIEKRCARWLLMASDRIGSDTMPMTHEFMSSMRGVRRAGVTETLGELQKSGLIRNGRAEITIIDRKGLEANACECYRVDHARLEKLL